MSCYVEYKIEVGLNTFFEGRLHKIWISENEKFGLWALAGPIENLQKLLAFHNISLILFSLFSTWIWHHTCNKVCKLHSITQLTIKINKLKFYAHVTCMS